ncbi:MAG: ATP-binding cassette domain-containing protein, partial [Clostridia bacterium]|nr:ATP-binding cassette domain-containing protein [Clostridia bacterium]
MLKRFLAYYKPHKRIFFFDMLAALLVSLVGIFYPVVTRTMLNDLIPNKNYRMVVVFGLTLLGLYFVRMLLNFFIQYYGHVMGVRMQAQMRSDMFNHLEKLPFSYYDDNETGKIMSRMTTDLWEISELAHHGPENLIISSVSIILSFVYLSTINIWLTLLVFACVPLLLFVSLFLRRRMRRAFKESRVAVAEINAALESSVSGIRVTKAFNNALKEHEKFEVGNGKFVLARRDAYKAMGQFHSINSFITDVFNVVVLIAGGFFLYNGQIEFGDYSAFIVSVGLFITPVMTLINFIEQYENGVTGFARFLEILDAAPETDPADAVELGRAKGEIELIDVHSSYDGKREILNGVSLRVEAGKTYALVGPSGGGKTTICHLLPHFYEIAEGQILLDGQDIRRISRASLRQNIGIVQQDVYLFNDT